MRRFWTIKNYGLFAIALIAGFAINGQNLSAHKDSSVVIYLTFDDGPSDYSPYLLSFLRKDSIPLTVFLVGQYVSGRKDGKTILQSYRDNPLVEIGNHSFSHAQKKYKTFYQKPEKVIDDLLLNEASLQLTNKIVRLPGRNVWRVNNKKRDDLPDAKMVADSLSKLGYRIFGWDLEWRYDSTSKSFYPARQMIRRIRQLTTNNKTFMPGEVVILCHDSMLQDEYVRQEMQLFFRKIKEESSWHFGHLVNYPADCNTSRNDFFQ